MKSYWRWVWGWALGAALVFSAPAVSLAAEGGPRGGEAPPHRGKMLGPEGRAAPTAQPAEKRTGDLDRPGGGERQRLRDRLRDGTCIGPACPMVPGQELGRAGRRGPVGNAPGAAWGGPRRQFRGAAQGRLGPMAGRGLGCPCCGCNACAMAANCPKAGGRLRLRDGSCMAGPGMQGRGMMGGGPAMGMRGRGMMGAGPRMGMGRGMMGGGPEMGMRGRGMMGCGPGPGMWGRGMRGAGPGMGQGPEAAKGPGARQGPEAGKGSAAGPGPGMGKGPGMGGGPGMGQGPGMGHGPGMGPGPGRGMQQGAEAACPNL